MVTTGKATQLQLSYKRGSNPRVLGYIYTRRPEHLAEGQAEKSTEMSIMWKSN